MLEAGSVEVGIGATGTGTKERVCHIQMSRLMSGLNTFGMPRRDLAPLRVLYSRHS